MQMQLEIEAQGKRFETALDNIVVAARRDIIKPFCDEHCLRFVSGMGSWTFEELEPDPDNPPVSNLDWDDYIDGNYAQYGDDYLYKEPPEGYDDVRETLTYTVEVTGRQVFEYMEDYDPSEEGGTNGQDS